MAHATLNGLLTDDGGEICSVGFEWGRDATNLDSSLIVSSGRSPLLFSVVIFSLLSNTKYYFRAFATNSIGTGYGLINSFTTGSPLPPIPGIPIIPPIPDLPPLYPPDPLPSFIPGMPTPPGQTTLKFINVGVVIGGGAGLALIMAGEKKKKVLDTWTGIEYKSWQYCAKDILTADELRKSWSISFKAKLMKMYPGRFIEVKEIPEPEG